MVAQNVMTHLNMRFVCAVSNPGNDSNLLRCDITRNERLRRLELHCATYEVPQWKGRDLSIRGKKGKEGEQHCWARKSRHNFERNHEVILARTPKISLFGKGTLYNFNWSFVFTLFILVFLGPQVGSIVARWGTVGHLRQLSYFFHQLIYE